MRDIDYDKNKIDLLFYMTEKSIEQFDHVQIVLERLAALEKIHMGSPDLAVQFQSVVKNQPEIGNQLGKEMEAIASIKETMVKSVKEIQEVLSSFLQE